MLGRSKLTRMPKPSDFEHARDDGLPISPSDVSLLQLAHWPPRAIFEDFCRLPLELRWEISALVDCSIVAFPRMIAALAAQIQAHHRTRMALDALELSLDLASTSQIFVGCTFFTDEPYVSYVSRRSLGPDERQLRVGRVAKMTVGMDARGVKNIHFISTEGSEASVFEKTRCCQ